MPNHPDATILIVSRNRKEDLRRAITSALSQEGNIEVLVYDDASTDGTAQMVAEEFPAVRLIRQDTHVGTIVLHNRGAQEARSPIIFSIDDDAVFTSPTTVRDAIPYFNHPRVGVVSLPLNNWVNGEMRPAMQPPPKDERVWCVPHYFGGAHAMSRKLFLTLGGYSEDLIHWGEEEEYSRKLWGAGYVIRSAATAPIYHYPNSVGRYAWRRRVLSRRNLILMELWHTPWRYLPHGLARAYGKFAKGLVGSRSPRNAVNDMATMGAGTFQALRGLAQRRPLSVAAHRTYLKVRGAKTLPLEEIEPQMGPPKFGPVQQYLDAHAPE